MTQPWEGAFGTVARRRRRKSWLVAAAASAPALPAAARAAAPAAAHPLMSPAVTPALGSPTPCVGGVQAGAPAGALEATHAKLLEGRRGVEGYWGPKVCVPKVAQPNFPIVKFRFFPR